MIDRVTDRVLGKEGPRTVIGWTGRRTAVVHLILNKRIQRREKQSRDETRK